MNNGYADNIQREHL